MTGSSFPLPATRADPTEKPPVKDNTGYSPAEIKKWLRAWPYISKGKFPPTDRAPDSRARGKVQFESKPPGPACAIHMDIEGAIRMLPFGLRRTVRTFCRAGSLGRTARWLNTPKSTVQAQFDVSVNIMAIFLAGPLDESPEPSPD